MKKIRQHPGFIDRQQQCEKLKKYAPKILNLTLTEDMGYEFSAILSEGVIFGEPGMLINYSGGHVPFDEWDGDTEEDFNKKLEKFCLGLEDYITPWDEVSNEDLIDLLDEISQE